jgi:dTDP-4-dehydrorhamnose reductase
LLTAADRLSEGWSHGYAGLYHACGAGETTWHGLATALFEEAERHGVPRPQIDAIATADWPTPVRRPADSRLECGKLARVFGVRLPDWRDSLADVVDRVFVRQLH